MSDEKDYPYIDEILDFDIEFEVVECDDLQKHVDSFVRLTARSVEKYIKHRYLNINRKEILDVIEMYAKDIRPKKVSFWENTKLLEDVLILEKEIALAKKRVVEADDEYEKFLNQLSPEERNIAINYVRNKYGKN